MIVLFFICKLQKDVSSLEMEVAYVVQQNNFCQSLLEKVTRGKVLMLLPLANSKALNTESMVYVPGLCVACSDKFASHGMVGVYTLPCKHNYHLLCFDYWIEIHTICATSTCESIIPKSIQTMLLYTTVKTHQVKQKLKERVPKTIHLDEEGPIRTNDITLDILL